MQVWHQSLLRLCASPDLMIKDAECCALQRCLIAFQFDRI